MTSPKHVRTGARPMEHVRAALALANGYPPQLQMYVFLVNVDGMEQCEALALAYNRPVKHTRRSGCGAASQ